MPGKLGLTEVLIVAFIILLLFGAKKIPEFVKGLGEAFREIKKGIKEK